MGTFDTAKCSTEKHVGCRNATMEPNIVGPIDSMLKNCVVWKSDRRTGSTGERARVALRQYARWTLRQRGRSLQWPTGLRHREWLSQEPVSERHLELDRRALQSPHGLMSRKLGHSNYALWVTAWLADKKGDRDCGADGWASVTRSSLGSGCLRFAGLCSND